MACERYQHALTEVAAGAPALAELEAHLVTCAACRQELDSLRRTLALVDGDLRELLSAEPSPDLRARIRQAAAEPLASPAWRPGFVLQALAAAAVLATALVVMRGRSPAPHSASAAVPGVPPANSATPQPGLTAAPVVEAGATAAPLPVAVPRQPRASMRPLAPREPEVMVPPGQAEALLRLLALVNRDRVAPPVLGATGQASPELAELRPIDVGPIDIKPLEIVPLDPAETSGT